jgi:hypothetical protein
MHTSLALAAQFAWDAQETAMRIKLTGGQMGLIRAAATLLEIATDHQCAQDYGPTATADEVLRCVLGDFAVRSVAFADADPRKCSDLPEWPKGKPVEKPPPTSGELL